MQRDWKKLVPRILAVIVLVLAVVAMWLAEHPTDIYQRKPLPTLELTNLQGEPVKLQDWSGPFIVNLFASWCTPCVKELPQLKVLAQHVPVYGIAWQDDPVALQGWLDKHEPAFKEVALENGTELLWKLRINGIPTTMVLDREYRIVHVHEGVITDADIDAFLPHIYNHK